MVRGVNRASRPRGNFSVSCSFGAHYRQKNSASAIPNRNRQADMGPVAHQPLTGNYAAMEKPTSATRRVTPTAYERDADGHTSDGSYADQKCIPSTYNIDACASLLLSKPFRDGPCAAGRPSFPRWKLVAIAQAPAAKVSILISIISVLVVLEVLRGGLITESPFCYQTRVAS